MADTATARLRLDLQPLGGNANSWGAPVLNTNLALVDDAVAGIASIALSGGTRVLSVNSYAADEARMATLVLTGTLASAATVVVPAVEKSYWIVNRTTGGYDVSIQATGSAVVIPRATACAVLVEAIGVVTLLVQENGGLLDPLAVPASRALTASDLGELLLVQNGTTLTLPPLFSVPTGWWVEVHLAATTGSATVAGAGGTLDGLTRAVLGPLDSLRIASTGLGWVTLFATGGVVLS